MNDLLKKAEKWLNELNIRTNAAPAHLMVHRDDMLILGIDQVPEVAYDFILKEIRLAIGTNKFYWGGKDDIWMYLETF
jgi:hypothetical protein